MKDLDFIVCGEVAGFEVLYAYALQSKGFETAISRHISKKEYPLNLPKGFEYSEDRVLYFNNSFEWLNICKNSRLVLSLGGAAMFNLQPLLWPFRKYLGLPPVIHISTGSDMIELVVENSSRGQHFREYLHWVNIVGMINSPKALSNAQNLAIPNMVFFYFPYLIQNDMSQVSPTGRIRFFHPSNLDWKITKSNSKRVGKGNDKFIKAFSRAIAGGLDAECTMVFRGPDREVAQKLVKELGLEDRIVWLPNLSREEFFNAISKSDVVVDQFDVGAAGGVFMEALGFGKPVLSYINPAASRLLYPEMPPILNCQTEDEIYEQIMKCSDRDFLRNLGALGNQWVNRYHSLENSTNQLLYYFSVLTGKKVFDFE